MDKQALTALMRSKKSFLCVGLDTDTKKLPGHLPGGEDPVFEFNKAIIDATKEYAVAYKINTAFYEAQGIEGWTSMAKTLAYIPKEIFTIADAKRGDIGNTAEQYAHTFFETFPFDSVTVAPYMGKDSVAPFLQFAGKWAIVLGLTSNEGSKDFQLQPSGGELLYERVLRTVASWGSSDNTMFVVGATRAEQLAHIRTVVPDHFLLVPGIGAQGGDLDSVAKAALNKDVGILVNVSRGIIFAGTGIDFADKAAAAAKGYQQQMARYF
ncbi:MAG: orotidine-5'-phosphate decarboxylase [Edaphocola sp.]